MWIKDERFILYLKGYSSRWSNNFIYVPVNSNTCSCNDNIIRRGRIRMKITMNENDYLVIEILGEPRNEVKQIIWVHGDGGVSKTERKE